MENEIKLGGHTADEWEALAEPQIGYGVDALKNVGMVVDDSENKDDNTSDKPDSNAETTKSDKLINKPSESDFEKLSIADTFDDVKKSVGAEALRVFVPKEGGLTAKLTGNIFTEADLPQYKPRTKAANNLKMLYRYGVGTMAAIGSFFTTGGLTALAAGTKAAQALKIAGGLTKTSKFLKTLSGATPVIKAGENASKIGKVGARAANAFLSGSVAGAIADFNLFRTDDDDTIFFDTKNDSEVEAKVKNVIEGFLIGGVFGEAVEFGISPILKRAFPKVFNQGEVTTVNAEQAIKDTNNIQNIFDTAKLYEETEKLYRQALDEEVEPDLLIVENIHPTQRADARKMVEMLQNGEKPFIKEDGTFCIKIEKWDDAYKVTPDEFKEQLLHNDNKKALLANDNELIREGDTALEFMNQSVKDTWVGRGWIGANEELNQKTATRIVKNYKDKFQIDNNIKVEFVDGLSVNKNGKIIPVEGNSQKATYLGKIKNIPKSKQNTIDRKKLQISKLEDRITIEEGSNAPVADTLDNLKEELRIAKNELKILENEAKGLYKEKLNDLKIQIDTNAKNPYAVLRAELEHIRDFAKGTVPNQKEKHFSRYEGLNEAEMAPSYIYKKAVSKKDRASQVLINDGQTLQETVHFKEGVLNGQQGTETVKGSLGSGKTEANRQSVLRQLGDYNRTSNGSRAYIRRSNVWRANVDEVGNLFDDAKLPKLEFKESSNNAQEVDTFYETLKTLKKNDKNKYAQVTLHSKEDYSKMRIFLGKDNNYGFAIKSDGEITSVFVAPNMPKGAGHSLMIAAKSAGGIKLDNFDTYLSKFYETHGFKEVPREKWNDKYIPKDVDGNIEWDKKVWKDYNNGEPDVVYRQLENIQDPPLNITSLDEAYTKLSDGSVAVKTYGDIDNLINEVVKLEPEISGFKLEQVKDDSEIFSKKLSELLKGADIDKYQQILATGDTEAIDKLIRKEIAARLLVDKLYKEIIELPENVSLDLKAQKLNILKYLSDYCYGIEASAGRGLVSQKVDNTVLESIAATHLSMASKEGVEDFSEYLFKAITDNLNFTQGKVLNIPAIRNSVLTAVTKYKDGALLPILQNSPKFSQDIQGIVDNYVKKGNRINKKELNKSIENILTNEILDEMQNNLKSVKSADGAMKTVRGFNDKVQDYVINNLLSNPVSTFRNVISGFSNTFYFPLVKIIGGGLTGNKQILREGFRTLQSLHLYMKDAWELGIEAFKKGNGKISNIQDVLDSNPSYNNWYVPTNLQELWEQIQNLHSFGARLMGASDEWLSQLNYRALTRAKAMEMADKVADNLGRSNDIDFINDLTSTFFNRSFDNKTGLPVDLGSYYEVKKMMYQNDLDGMVKDPVSGKRVKMKDTSVLMGIGGTVNSFANKHWFIKNALPFLKTSVDIAQFNLEHSPIYNILSTSQRKILFGAASKEKSEMVGRMFMGSLSLLLGLQLAFTGKVTGSAPIDQKERKALYEAGWRPYSVVIGDKYYSYQGIEPLQHILAPTADYVALASKFTDPVNDYVFEEIIFETLRTVIPSYLDTSSYRQGMSLINDLLNVDDENGWKRAMSKYIQNFVPSTSLVKAIGNTGEHSQSMPDKDVTTNILNNYYQGMRGDLRRDVFGNTQDVYSIFGFTRKVEFNETPEYEELENLARYGYSPTDASKVISSKLNYKLTDFKNENGRSLYDRLQEEVSKTVINGKTLQEAVRELVTSDYYNKLPLDINTNADKASKFTRTDDTKLNSINDIFREYADEAKLKISDLYAEGEYINDKGETVDECINRAEIERGEYLDETRFNSLLDEINSFW